MTRPVRSSDSAQARLAVLLATALLLPGAAGAQTVDGEPVTERLTVLAEENAAMYLQPVAAGLGAGLNSGFFESAGGDGGVHVHVGLQVSGSFIPADANTFSPHLPETISYEDRTFSDPYGDGDTISTPTAAGEGRGVVLEPTGEYRDALLRAGKDLRNFAIPFPDGVDLPAVPMAMAEASVSLPTGTAVMARFLPEIDISDEVGPVSSYGFGVRQSVSPFLRSPPVDVGVALGIQKLTVGDIVDATGRSIDVLVSKDLDVLTVFASGGLEGTSVDVEYTLDSRTDIPGQPADGTTISFPGEGESYPAEGANSSRFTGGIRVNLFVARLSVSYTAANYDVLQARLSFGS